MNILSGQVASNIKVVNVEDGG